MYDSVDVRQITLLYRMKKNAFIRTVMMLLQSSSLAPIQLRQDKLKASLSFESNFSTRCIYSISLRMKIINHYFYDISVVNIVNIVYMVCQTFRLMDLWQVLGQQFAIQAQSIHFYIYAECIPLAHGVDRSGCSYSETSYFSPGIYDFNCQDGPCAGVSNVLSVPNSLLGGTYTQFTIEGWFKRNQATSTSNNLLWLIGPDTNNYASFHLAASLNDQLVIRSCNGVGDCLIHTSTEVLPTDTADQWVYVMVSIDYTTKRLHFKLLKHSDSMVYPYVFAETHQYQFTTLYLNTQGIVIKNKATNLHGLNGFCGKVNYVTYYGDLFLTTSNPTYDIDARLLAYWLTTAITGDNLLSPTQDKGRAVGSIVVDGASQAWGWQFQKGDYIAFDDQRSVFGPRWTISAHMKILKESAEMIFFSRFTIQGNPIISIKVTSSTAKFSILVSVKNIPADPHGSNVGDLLVWVPVTIACYNNYNYFASNPNPGMMMFDLLTPTVQEYSKKTYELYSDQADDMYYIGDYPTTTTSSWLSSEYFAYANVKIFTGFSYELHDETDNHILGCARIISELYRSCVMCRKAYNSANSNNYKMCSEAGQPLIPASLTRTDIEGNPCPSGTFYELNQCKEIAIRNCIRFTSGSSTCDRCSESSTQAGTPSATCTLPAYNTQCSTGSEICTIIVKRDYSSTIKYQKSTLCSPKYFLSGINCLSCESTCATCKEATKCLTCEPNNYIQTANSLCASTCPDPELKDKSNSKCVAACAINQFIIEAEKACVNTCPSTHVTYQSKCLDTCPTSTYEEAKVCKSCHNKCWTCTGPTNLQCQSCTPPTYFLSNNVCEDFCSDATKFADEIKSQCVSTCDSPGVEFGKKCLYVCPEGYSRDTNRKCVKKCPAQYVSKTETKSVTIPLIDQTKILEDRVCVPCETGCTACTDVKDVGTGIENCTACITTQFLIEQNCESTCTVTYPFEDSYNQRCLAECPPQFFIDGQKCVLKCPNGTFSNDRKCEANCPAGRYKETSNNICTYCADECLTCTEGGPSNCQSCKPGFYLYNSTCIQVCPSDKKFHNTVNGECVATCPNLTLIDGYILECYAVCPSEYNQDGNNCVHACSLGKYLDASTCVVCDSKCLRCQDGTNRKCSKCAVGYYLDGKTCATTCEENPGRYMSDYGYVCLEICPITMYMVDDLKKCVVQCPPTHVRLESHCLISCPKGQYNESGVCALCPPQCVECTSYTSCTVCKPKYFQQADKCLHSCENGYFQDLETQKCIQVCSLLINDDGLGNKQCIKECSLQKVLYVNQCLYECPDGFYKQKSPQVCAKCTLECKTCTGGTNQDCIECANGYEWKDEFCVGKCPIGSFLNSVSCEKCAFRCLQCYESKYTCKECRGDRGTPPNCYCRDGYYDDRKSLNCQQCQAPCVNCSSKTICTSCKFNLEPPDCLCKRPPPILTDFCISCTLGFAEQSRFSNDFSMVIVTFTYNIKSDNNEAYFYSSNNCLKWFDNDNFGESAVCMQNGKSFNIQLGYNPTILPGEPVKFKPNTFVDTSSQLCQNKMIQEFRNTEIVDPIQVYPNVQLKYPKVGFTNCIEVKVEIVKITGNAGRKLKFEKWTANPTTAALDDILAKATPELLTLPAKILDANTNYTLKLKYSNFLGFEKSSQVLLQTKSENPTIILDFEETDVFYGNYEIEIPFSVYAFTCESQVVELTDGYTVELDVRSVSSGTTIVSSSKLVGLNDRVGNNFMIEKNQLLPNSQYKVTVKIGEVSDSKVLAVGRNQLNVEFLTKDRIVNMTDFKLAVNASDSDVPENISQIGIQYSWTCKNMHFNIPCRTLDKNLLTMAEASEIVVGNLSAGYTYLFTCKISKDDRSILLNQQIIITNYSLEAEQSFNTDLGNKIEIRVTDNLLYALNVNRYYLVILKQYQILHIELIEKPVMRLNLYTYLSKLDNSTDINVIIGGSDTRYNFYVNPALYVKSIKATPQTGYSLQTVFDIILNEDEKPAESGKQSEKRLAAEAEATEPTSSEPSPDSSVTQFQYYIYTDELTLRWDMANFSNINGFLIQDWTVETKLATKLPSCKFLLVKINQGELFGFSYIPLSVNASETVVSIRNNIQYVNKFIDYEKVDINLDYLILLELHFIDRIKCNYDCWNRGDCVNSLCICDANYYYFADCSGVQGDQNSWNKLGSKLYSDLQSAEVTQVVFNAFELIFQLSKFDQIGSYAANSTDLVFNQLDSYLSTVNSDIGIVQQSKQVVNYNAAFNILSFLASLNTQLFKDNSLKTQIKDVNEKLNQSYHKLVDLTQKSILDSETVTYSQNYMNITVSRRKALTRVLAEGSSEFKTTIESYFQSNIYRLNKNFPYPNHTQPLYYSTEAQTRIFGNFLQVIPERKPLFMQSPKNNFLCILSKDEGQTFDDVGCKQMSKTQPIECQCEPGFVTLVDDGEYIFKPFYFETEYKLDRLFSLAAIGGITLIFAIMALIGHFRDQNDWDTVKPIQDGFALKRDVVQVVTKLRRGVAKAQIAPSSTADSASTINNLFSQVKAPEDKGDLGQGEDEGLIQEVFLSKAQPQYCPKHNSFLGVVFQFRKHIGRKQRAWLILGRLYLLFGLSGLLVNEQIVQIEIIAGVMAGIGFLVRILNVFCRIMNSKAKKEKLCKYQFISYLITFSLFCGGGICFALSYLVVYDRLIIYWVIASGAVIVVDLVATDIILQLCQLLFDYFIFKQNQKKREEVWAQAFEETQRQRIYGHKGTKNYQEVVL